MKNKMTKLIATALILVGFASVSNAQSTATATASATIVTPISITKNADMNFGNVAVQNTTSGTVVLATDGSRTKTNGVTLPAAAGSPAAASFTVNGNANYTYAITLPSTITLTRASGSETMTADNFTSSLGATGTLSSGGTQNFTVGSTLNVAAAQVAGTYTSANFNVTVNYN